MTFGLSTTSTLVTVSMVVAVLALVTAVSAQRRITALRNRYRVLWAHREKDLIAVVSHQSGSIAHMQDDVAAVRAQLTRTAGDVAQSLRHVAVVRYDASGEVGDQLSFSAAIIDGRGDGLVISSIHARGESRTYAKGIVEGISEVMLSPQEQQSLDVARTGKGTT